MKQLFQEDSPEVFGLYLDEEKEAETLTFAIGLLLVAGTISLETEETVVDTAEYLAGRELAEELAKDIQKGVRILVSAADFYLAEISLDGLRGFFNWSVVNGGHEQAAQEQGITVDEFVEHAVNACQMLEKIPIL